MKTFYEIKTIDVSAGAEIKDVDMKSRTVVGYFSRFGNVDHDGDMLVNGAFTKTIKERGLDGKNLIPHLADHTMDTDHLLGRPKVYEVNDGGMFESKITDTNKGNDVLKQYRDNLIFNHSFGFKTLNKADKKGYREIKEVLLYEVSSVVLGANEETPFTGFKSMSKPQIIEQYNHLVKCYRDGDYTDDFFPILEAQIKQFKENIVDLYIKEQTQTEIAETTKPVATTSPEVKAFVLQMELNRFVNTLKS